MPTNTPPTCLPAAVTPIPPEHILCTGIYIHADTRVAVGPTVVNALLAYAYHHIHPLQLWVINEETPGRSSIKTDIHDTDDVWYITAKWHAPWPPPPPS